MTHRANKLAETGWKNIEWVQKHMEMISLLYTVFTRKIMSQLYEGICESDDNFKYSSAKQDCESRFNSALFPAQNINRYIAQILITLKFIVSKKPECMEYNQKVSQYNNNVYKVSYPKQPDENKLLSFWNNPSHILRNAVIACILCTTEKFGNLVGSKNRNIISNYDEVNNVQVKLHSFQQLSFSDFEITEDEDVPVVDERNMNMMELFLHNLSYDGDRKIIRLNKARGIHWSYRMDHLEIEFKKVMAQLSKSVITRIPHYFDEAKRKLMKNLKYLFDPKSYSLYDTFDASSSHGNNVIESALKYYKYKRVKMGNKRVESYRTFQWKKFDINKALFEYKILRRILFDNKDLYPSDSSVRINLIVKRMEEQANVFPNLLMLCKRLMTFFSGVIDIERANGFKKWIVSAKRESLKSETLDMILRVFFNSPDIDDYENKKQWLVACAKIWNNMANRTSHNCEQLDIESGKAKS